QIDALTAEPKMSAVVLGLMPVALFLIVAMINRDYMAPLWTTPGGRLLSLYALVSIVLGYLLMKKIGKIDI
ncbi:MAG TPA: hypothetical protein VN717_05560, partial [Gemmatimonadaceae bacterium]|nr:hypothetical protein [Gemmatimonadaceae bacterium]